MSLKAPDTPLKACSSALFMVKSDLKLMQYSRSYQGLNEQLKWQQVLDGTDMVDVTP
jgi:hypothetical protein